jgi:outer membrane lipoprotein-sorting protein
MKKIFLCLVLICLVLTGCGKKSEKAVLDKFNDLVMNSDAYYLSGNMELVNNEDVYTYDVMVSYMKDDYYKIELTNVINNHKQIILRNILSKARG